MTGVVDGVETTSPGINATHAKKTLGNGFQVQRKLLGLKTKSTLFFGYRGADPYAAYPVGKKIMGKSITGATDVVFTVTGFLEAKTKPAAAHVDLRGTVLAQDGDAPAPAAGSSE